MRNALYKKIYTYLRDEIKVGTYAPGELIPTEQELMERFGVSRMTTNRALQMLASEGVIQRRAGLGSFVSNNNVLFTQECPSSKVSDSVNEAAKNALIGFIVPFISPIYGLNMLSTLEKLTRERGMALTIVCSYAEQELEKQAIKSLTSLGVKGIIVFPVNGDFYNPELLRLHVEGFPLVLVDKNFPGVPIPHVVTDNKGAAITLTQHLIDLGHRNIACFSPRIEDTPSLVDRFNGYKSALDEAGINYEPAYCVESLNLEEGGYTTFSTKHLDIIREFLESHPEVTAIVATDYGIAEHTLEAALSIHKKVPEELSIVCFDGPEPQKNQWNFTHIIQDEIEMAKHAVNILSKLIEGHLPDNLEHRLLPAKLFIGDSSTTR